MTRLNFDYTIHQVLTQMVATTMGFAALCREDEEDTKNDLLMLVDEMTKVGGKLREKMENEK